MDDIILKNFPQPIYIYDKESLKFLNVNDAALKLYGYSIDEFLQLDLTDLYTPEDIQNLIEMSSAHTAEGVYSGILRHRKKDGTYVNVRISKIHFYYESTEAYLDVVQEVSELFELERKKQIYKTAFDNTDDMIFITDLDGTITFINEAVTRNLDISADKLLNTILTKLCNEEDKVLIHNSVFNSHIKDTVTFTVELKIPEGKRIEVDVVSNPVFDIDSKVESYVLIAKQVKEQNVFPPMIEEEPKVLDDDIIDNKSEPAVSVSLKRDSSLFREIFHEILTPINVIFGFTQELTDSVSNPTPEQQEAINILNQNRTSLMELMNSVVEFSELESEKTEVLVSEVPVTEIIETLDKNIAELTGIKDLKSAYGKISSSLKFVTDTQKFIGLVANLFRLISGISSKKKLYFSAYPEGKESFNISISDAFGRSSSQLTETLKLLFIDKKDPRVFGISNISFEIINSLLEMLKGEAFELHSGSDKHDIIFRFPIKLPGKLKENITKNEEHLEAAEELKLEDVIKDNKPSSAKMIEEIEFEEAEEIFSASHKKSKEAGSVDFQPDKLIKADEEIAKPKELHLPEKKEVPVNKNGLSSLRCLYIEDQVDSQILFRVQMKDLKSIQFAASFEEALPLLQSNDFDFIIMDINLQGDYNGLDALKAIHRIPKFERTPVIAVTAYVLPGDKEKFIATGFTDFISKPIFRDKLIDSLKKIFVN
jgi:PAS domain S-box-containing protein